MSRSKKGSKGPGHEYWTKRPGNECGGDPGEFTKNRTHRLERLEARKAERNRELEYCPCCDGSFEDMEQTHYCSRCNNYDCECEC